MNRSLALSQSAPSFQRPGTAPCSQGSLPSIQQHVQRRGSTGDQGLVPKSATESMLKSLQMHGSMRSSSPPRPGSTGSLSLSASTCRPITPYLLSGLSDPVESHNSFSKVAMRKMFAHGSFETAAGEKGLKEEDGYAVIVNEKEFTQASEGVEKRLKDLYWQLESFDPLNTGAAGWGKRSSRRANQDEDDDEEADNLRERFEQYKMVRKIEPELPPLTPMPALSLSNRLPDLPMIEYNLSQEALDNCSTAARTQAIRLRKVHRDQLRTDASGRRAKMLAVTTAAYSKALQQKKKQAEGVIAARFAGGVKADMRKDVPVELVAEKWVVVSAIAGFLKGALEDVMFNRKPLEERRQAIMERQSVGIVKRSDAYHLRSMQLDEYMKDNNLTARLFMIARMYQSRVHVKRQRKQIERIYESLTKWQPRSTIFLKFKSFTRKVKYLQGWWRRTSKKLKEIRDQIAKRWEKIERLGTSGYHAVIPSSKDIDIVDPVKRAVFLENELRARRFYVVARLRLWEEDAAKWRVQHENRKKGSRIDYDFIPHRPSCLPPDHLYNESATNPCREKCLGRQGDNEILAMIKAARSNPKGGGWKEIPQKQAEGSSKKTKKVAEENQDETDVSGAARLFGEVTTDDLERWGVHPSNMPRVGKKPGTDEGEGFYP